jgi:hypothetical protein
MRATIPDGATTEDVREALRVAEAELGAAKAKADRTLRKWSFMNAAWTLALLAASAFLLATR